MSFEQYDKGIRSQLNDTQCYIPLKSNPTEQIKTEIDSYIESAFTKEWITEKEKLFLITKHPICPVFYGLPKIHKSVEDPPLRPIVSSMGCVTEPLSQYVDFFIKKYLPTLPSYLGDTTDVLKTIDSFKCGENMILATLDVQSLYTCIPHTAGLEALTHYLNTRPTDIQPPNEFLLTLTEIILSKNFFQYAGSYFLQGRGVSMGSSFSPSYACLVMGLWEERFIHNSSNNPFHSKIALWKRYIDDILLLWNGTQAELDNFILYVNSTSDYLAFTAEYDLNKVNFLDLTIHKGVDNLCTTIYRKPLSRNTLLRAESNHPKHLVKNIPVGQFLRLRRNCSTDSEFQSKAVDMKERFLSRGYSEYNVSRAFTKASRTDRSSLLVKKQPAVSPQRLCFSTEFSPRTGEVKNVILKHWHVLQNDPTLMNICAQPPIFSCRKSRSIKDRVVHSMIQRRPISPPSWLSTPPVGFFRCGRCVHCSNSNDTKYFTHPRTGKKYSINSFINCNSTHVVYMLKCPCGLVYIGQTKRALKLRIAEHKAAIRNNNMDYAIARHYVSANHGSPASLKFWGIEKIEVSPRGGDIINRLLRRESFWIHELNSVEPLGLNEENNLSCFL